MTDGFLAGFSAMAQAQNIKSQIEARRSASAREEEAHRFTMQKAIKEREITRKMAEVSQKGGIPAVMDYLKGADPDRYLQFSTSKSKLDKSILGNEKLKVEIKRDKLGVLKEAYSIMGSLGARVEGQADPAMKSQMYQLMLPLIKSVVPGAPDSYGSTASGMLQLSMGLASPQALAYSSKKQELKLQSPIAKVGLDIAKLEARGVSDTHPLMLSLKAKQDKHLQEAEKYKLDRQKAELSMMKSKLDMETKIISDLKKESEDFVNVSTAYQKVQSVYNNIDKLKGAGDNALVRLVARMFDKGVLSEDDVAGYKGSDPTVKSIQKLYTKHLKDGSTLTPSERLRLLNLARTVYQGAEVQQNHRESRTKSLAQRYGIPIQGIEEVIVRAKSTQHQTSQAPDAAVEALRRQPELLDEFIQKYGYTPEGF